MHIQSPRDNGPALRSSSLSSHLHASRSPTYSEWEKPHYCAATPQHSAYSQLPAHLKSACSNSCRVQPRCTSDGMQSAEWERRLSPQRGPSFKSLPFWADGSLSAKRRHTPPHHLTGTSSCRVNCHGQAPMALLPSDPLTACKSGLWASCHQKPVSNDTPARYPLIGAIPRLTRTRTRPSRCINPPPSPAVVQGYRGPIAYLVESGREQDPECMQPRQPFVRVSVNPRRRQVRPKLESLVSATQTDALVPATVTRTTQH